jgi:hypothetical protein
VSVPQTDSRNLHALMRLLAFVLELMNKLVARCAPARRLRRELGLSGQA